MTREQLDQLLETLWQDFLVRTPDARRIHSLLAADNPQLQTDHLSLHTLALPRVNITHLARPFERAGYSPGGEFDITGTRLFARHYQHPDPALPKLLITELNVDSLGDDVRNILHQLISQIPPATLQRDDFCLSGRHWKIDFDSYQQLQRSSPHAAWIAAFGFRAHHYALLINSLSEYSCIDDLNDYLLEQGIRLDCSNGLVQGSADEYLEQSATIAGTTEVAFSDRSAPVAGSHYAFIHRYPGSDGRLYPGFIRSSAAPATAYPQYR
ncbi:DUF1338 domain-containing protein [Marinobacterium rhizophilum]|uniref:2-oxoadipate dioxygenase/decarboxylase n=1 Tax=Marinobacterium rhizophilum TaxID=420402 RepID=A0ABY5HHC8_9GAMM|nr:DUF1338 domain-containing protein [Marinobacterium rhizophilum]UTW10699.1 DUF1338 domain-containing protein [Marinobacterium rhizophilum]